MQPFVLLRPLCGTVTLAILIAGSAMAGSITVGLYADAATSPGPLISVIGTLNDSQLTGKPVNYDFPVVAANLLTAGQRYWIGVATSDNSRAAWGITGDLSGTGVGLEYSRDGFLGLQPNTISEAFQMRITTSVSGVIFDSLDFFDLDVVGGFEPDPVLDYGPLYGSFTALTGDSLVDVKAKLINVAAPEPSSLAVAALGLGLLALLRRRCRGVKLM